MRSLSRLYGVGPGTIASGSEASDSVSVNLPLELAVEVRVSNRSGSTRHWKLLGPDANGSYGGLQGMGGQEGICTQSLSNTGALIMSSWTGLIDDYYGHIVAYVDGKQTTATSLLWQSTHSIGYGPTADSPVFYVSEGTTLVQATAWRGKRQDITGFYWMGARYYEPTSGRFLSPDPMGHAASLSLYDYAGGDPVNFVDPTGRSPSQQMDDYDGHDLPSPEAPYDGEKSLNVTPAPPGGGYSYNEFELYKDRRRGATSDSQTTVLYDGSDKGMTINQWVEAEGYTPGTQSFRDRVKEYVKKTSMKSGEDLYTSSGVQFRQYGNRAWVNASVQLDVSRTALNGQTWSDSLGTTTHQSNTIILVDHARQGLQTLGPRGVDFRDNTAGYDAIYNNLSQNGTLVLGGCEVASGQKGVDYLASIATDMRQKNITVVGYSASVTSGLGKFAEPAVEVRAQYVGMGQVQITIVQPTIIQPRPQPPRPVAVPSPAPNPPQAPGPLP